MNTIKKIFRSIYKFLTLKEVCLNCTKLFDPKKSKVTNITDSLCYCSWKCKTESEIFEEKFSKMLNDENLDDEKSERLP